MSDPRRLGPTWRPGPRHLGSDVVARLKALGSVFGSGMIVKPTLLESGKELSEGLKINPLN